MKNNNLIYFISFFFIPFFLIMGTGLHSDDYSALELSKSTSISDFFNISIYSKGQTIFGIFNHYFFYWTYEILNREYDYIYDLLKIFIHILSFILFYKFISSYLNKENSIIFTLIFIFSPLHDSSTYWYMTVPYIFTASIILYCHYLIRENYIKTGFLTLIFSSFLSYSSPPYIFGASMIFLIEKKFFKFFVFVFPGIIYVFLYLIYSYYFPQFENRINDNLNLIFILKNFLLQLFSSFDALIGPSSIMKYLFSILHNSLISLIFALLCCFIFYKYSISKKINYSKSLFLGLFTIYFLSLIMFSLTGYYIQSPFNLGNRTLIYGSVFVTYIIILFFNNLIFKNIFIIFFILSIFGLSQYWKDINVEQKKIINNINNFSFSQIDSNSTLFVDGNMYFNLGVLSHVEFFTAPWVLESIFKNTNKNIKNLSAIKKHIKIRNNEIIDIKTENKIELGNSIFIYDSITNNLKQISREDLIKYINEKKVNKRHWVQLIDIKILNEIIVKLSPRLNIYFDDE